jgi:predicted nucleic acid-binding protein
MNWLIDTNVISESRRSNPAPAVAQWISSVALGQSYTSAMVVAELVYGAAMATDISKRLALHEWIENIVRPWFDGRTLAIDEGTLVRWRILRRDTEARKQPAPAVDLLIAATALEHELVVATRDTAPFVGAGIPVINPWTGERFNGA